MRFMFNLYTPRKSRLNHQAIQRDEFDKLVSEWETFHILPTTTQTKLNKEDIMNIDSSLEKNGNKSLDSASLKLLLRKFLFFFREKSDQERLDKIATFLLDNLRNFSKLAGNFPFFYFSNF